MSWNNIKENLPDETQKVLWYSPIYNLFFIGVLTPYGIVECMSGKLVGTIEQFSYWKLLIPPLIEEDTDDLDDIGNLLNCNSKKQ